MAKTELEVIGEEPKDEAVKEQGVKSRVAGFVRRHKKKIIFGGSAILLGIATYVWVKSSNDSDEKNDDDWDGYDDSYDSNTYADINVNPTNQTSIPRIYPKRDINGIDVTGSRLMDYEKNFLENFSTQYDRFKGKEQTIERNDYGISSDGKYTRHNEIKYSFPEDKMGINVNRCYRDDDDGQTGESNETIDNGRDLINFFKENKNLKMFADVQDIVDMYPKADSES